MRYLVPVAALMLTAAVAARAGEIHDDFDGGSNPDVWQVFPGGGGVIVDSGGNPGGWLSSTEMVSFGIDFRTYPQPGSLLAQLFAERRMTSFAFDFQRQPITCQKPGDYQHLMLILTVTHGTPDDPYDDDFAYYIGDEPPTDVGVWLHQSFDLPANAPDLPPGWTGGYVDDPEHFRDGVTWADFITQVDEIDVDTVSPFEFHRMGCYNGGIDSIVIGYDDGDAIFANGFE